MEKRKKRKMMEIDEEVQEMNQERNIGAFDDDDEDYDDLL